MKKRQFILLLIILTSMGCIEKTKNSIQSNGVKSARIEAEVKYIDSKTNTRLSSIRPRTQIFEIDGNRDTTIIGKGGTQFFIPANVFENAKNKVQTGNVQIELIEALAISDFFMHDLQTVGSGGYLESGGMIYVNATSRGENLRIRKELELLVECPTNKVKNEMQIFSGSFKDNQILWEKTGEIDHPYLVTVPFSSLKFGEIILESSFSKTQIKKMTNPKYSHSFIATTEFRERLQYLIYFTSGKNDENDHLGNPLIPGDIDDKIIEMYCSKIDQNLSDVDQMVLNFIRSEFKLILRSNYNQEDPNYFTQYYLAAICSAYETFVKQELGKPLDIQKYNLSTSSTGVDIDQLNISNNERIRLKKYFLDRSNKINALERETKFSENLNYSFGITRLGWTNVDSFFNGGDFSNFTVKIEKPNQNTELKVCLVIPSKNIMINGFISGENYTFTHTKEPKYSKLPIDLPAYIVVFGMDANHNYFSSTSIKIPKSGNFQIDLKKMSLIEIKAELEKLNPGT